MTGLVAAYRYLFCLCWHSHHNSHVLLFIIPMTSLVAAYRYLFEFCPVNTELVIPSQLIVEGPVSQPQCLIHFLLTVALIISSCLTAI